VLKRHCDAVGRDVGDIRVSTQALVFMSDDESFLDNMRGAEMPRATMIGTPKQVGEILAEYVEIGVDEFIVPDFTLGPMPAKLATLDRFITEVAGR
jgi:alkanesulfonate monooxygenase SsuD/methylene tetrahydromethanopterin reductase-like flavin-dependent oxidoreductase (luciferase family)